MSLMFHTTVLIQQTQTFMPRRDSNSIPASKLFNIEGKWIFTTVDKGFFLEVRR
jgi:hypothetical protein